MPDDLEKTANPSSEELPQNGSNELFPERLRDREISTEMQESYLDYAMSVIVSRALPDVRDGLKPVHRRILYSMHELGLKNNAKFRKSALVVGDVLGKYHPHGDVAVYDSMVRMAQDFAMRNPLIEGQGNFGSIDGDSPAAMRYTEAKMSKIVEEMLADIEKETINWKDNYDGSRKEPSVLPSKIPQLLLNGTMGIAVGMATNIPPHNLNEIIDALIILIENPDSGIDEIMEVIKGPDFPTGGIIYDIDSIKSMYVNGRGGVIIRGKAEIIESVKGRFQILINEIPFQVNKAVLVSKIADLVKEKKLIGISDIRDESNREGMRIMIDLKKEAFPKKLLNQLYKLTALQTTFNMNLIALVDGLQPQLLNLKSVLEHFIAHRKTVIKRRTEFELKEAKARAHILEGLNIALQHIDEVIETIKKSDTKEEASQNLIVKFKLTKLQADEILAMRLQTLAGLERQKIINEYKQKLALIKELEAILQSAEKISKIIKEELIQIKKQYHTPRRTLVISNPLGKLSSLDTIPNEEMIIVLSKENYIKRVSQGSFRAQNRGGKGVIGVTTKEEDEIQNVLYAKNHDSILYFTNFGRVFCLPVYEIVQATKVSKGQPIQNLLKLKRDEKVTAMVKLEEKSQNKYLIMATKYGVVKKTSLKAFQNIRPSGIICIKIKESDQLEWVKEASPGDEIIMVTSKGKCIRFPEQNVREMGRASMGVRGIRLKEDARVVEMDISRVPEKSKLLIVTENGIGKSSLLVHYRNQNRGGQGIKTANINEKTGPIIKALIMKEDLEGDLIIVSRFGQVIRLNLKHIPVRGRATQGVYLMRMKSEDKIASISLINKENELESNPKNKENAIDQLALSEK